MRTIMTFVRCVRAGSITGGAREMGISVQAASKHIRDLEAEVGVTLLQRNTRKCAVTEAGAMFYERCQSALEHIDQGLRMLQQDRDEVSGRVRLAVTPFSIARTLVGPLLPRLLERYPRLSVDVIAQNDPADVVGQIVDVGLVLGASPPPLRARKIADVEMILCAAPAYLQQHGIPASPEDLPKHRWVAIRNPAHLDRPFPFRFVRKSAVVSEKLPLVLTANDGGTVLRALIAGAGIGQIPAFRARKHIRSGKLVALDLGYLSDELALHVYVPQQEQAPRRSVAVADFLFEHLSRHPELSPAAAPGAARPLRRTA